MTLAQQDLLIRDTINSSVISAVLSVGDQSLPTGRVMLIRHPWVDGQTNYLGTDGTILTRSSDDNIVVAKIPAAAALGLPTSDDAPVPDVQSTSVAQEIIITNPSTNRESVSYNLGGRQYTIAPNQTQRLPVGTNWQIDFLPRPGAAIKQYSLTSAGTFAFVVNNGQWDLQAQQFSVRLNNPANSNNTLHYIANQQTFEVLAGSMVEHKSMVPLLIQFDRGNGSATATKLIESKGDYLFSLNQETKWELFRIPNGDEAAPAKGTDNNQLTIMRPPLASLRQGAGTMLFDFGGAVAAPSG
ncbi:MAG: hypothetical protein HYV60_12090, partial [Planctomycetia bacterium]|nr:hypothetical protein [Planctomycetia bacterium]